MAGRSGTSRAAISAVQRLSRSGSQLIRRGHGTVNGATSRPGARLADVARRAGVSAGTVSNVLNRPDVVTEPIRLKVLEAITDLGYVRKRSIGGVGRALAPLRFRDLAPPTCRHGVVSPTRQAGGTPGVSGRRAVARDSGTGSRSVHAR
ncbi:LacI family DNA-binding transcriptional regulator [Streptomyces sp. NPDC087843]|uniref:LacI family DNA-binding transcriptional regulator n=1 Tax=Streptomyces sp. NPDC087843 TaxID=3365804 RepID=UPI0037F43EA9